MRRTRFRHAIWFHTRQMLKSISEANRKPESGDLAGIHRLTHQVHHSSKSAGSRKMRRLLAMALRTKTSNMETNLDGNSDADPNMGGGNFLSAKSTCGRLSFSFHIQL